MKLWKKIVSFVLCLMLLVGMMPIGASAEGEPQEFTVRFYDENGTEVNQVSVTEGGTVLKPEVHNNQGQVIAQWYTDQAMQNPYSFSSAVTGDLALYGKWEAGQSTVEITVEFLYYYRSSGDLYDPAGQIVTKSADANGRITQLPPAPAEREHYTFGGWLVASRDANNVIQVYNDRVSEYTFTCGALAVPLWIIDTYKVSYVSNGGSQVPEETVDHGSAATKPADPTREGYHFQGWYTDEGLTALYDFSTPVTADITLYAKWLEAYTITYELQGGALAEGAVNPASYNSETPTFTLNNPTKNGNTFLGWTGTQLNQKTLEVTVPTGSTGNRAYVANWKPHAYKVIFHANDGTDATEEQNFAFGEEKPLRKNTFTREGYRFMEWNLDPESHTYYYEDERVVCDMTSEDGGEVHLYARWIEEYAITYELQGGALEEGKTNPGAYTYYSDPITLNNPARAGFTFLGWTGTGLTGNTLTVTIPAYSEGDRTYTAQWEAIPYTITYNLDGGALAEGTTNPTQYNAASDPITLNNPAKAGYTFLGWTGTDLTGNTVSVTIPTGSTGNREYTAHWEAAEYTITYNLDGGALAEGAVNPASYTYWSDPITLNNPTKAGHTFLGWTGTDLTGNTLSVTIPTGSEGNRTYTARWQPHAYKVVFHANGGTGTMADQDFTFGQAQNLRTNAFTRTDCRFLGWNTAADGTGTAYANEASVRDLTTQNGGTVNLYAQWENLYTVHYAANGGKGTMEDDIVPAGKYTLPKCGFTAPTGKIFKCWKIGTKEYKPGDVIDVTADVTVTAVWQKKAVNPYTGDDSGILLWSTLAVCSALAAGFLFRKRRFDN